jgi:hypothetical protein
MAYHNKKGTEAISIALQTMLLAILYIGYGIMSYDTGHILAYIVQEN